MAFSGPILTRVISLWTLVKSRASEIWHGSGNVVGWALVCLITGFPATCGLAACVSLCGFTSTDATAERAAGHGTQGKEKERTQAAAPVARPFVQLELHPFMPRAQFQGAVSLSVETDGETQAVDYSPYGLCVNSRRVGRLSHARIEEWRKRLEKPEVWRMRSAVPQLAVEGDIFELHARLPNEPLRTIGGNLALATEVLKSLVDEWLKAALELKPAPASAGYLRISALSQAAGPKRTRLEDLPPKLQSLISRACLEGRTFTPLNSEMSQAAARFGQQFFIEYQQRLFEVMQFSSREPAVSKPDP